MPVARAAAGPCGEAAGASSPPSSSCLRWFNFISNIFEGELTLDEKLALQVLRRLASTPFERGRASHEQLLHQLYVLCFANADEGPLKEEDPLWKQSPDPRRDFRGGGLLALQNLCFFRANFPDAFLSFQIKSCHAGFPMAAALINVTHMLTGYLRLTDAAGLGAGEPQASRRSARCFARLCLMEDGEDATMESCLCHASVFRDSSRSGGMAALQVNFSGVAPSISDSALLQESSAASAAKREDQAQRAPFPRRLQSCEGRGGGPAACCSEGPRRAALRLHVPLRQPHSPELSSARGCCAEQLCSAMDAHVLNAFGHLYVYACMRLEQELGRRGAWDPDEIDADAFLLRPCYGNGLLCGLRRLQDFRRASHEPLASPPSVHAKGHHHRQGLFFSPASRPGGSPPSSSKAEEKGEGIGGCGAASGSARDAALAVEAHRTTSLSPCQSTASPPPEAQQSRQALALSPRPSAACRPSRLLCGIDDYGSSRRQSEGGEGQPVNKRAHLCFGDALKEVRSVVDAVLSDGTLQNLQDLELIRQG
ncbi:hypothetical protein Efla_003518 [Eimeria flavescens]